MAEYIERKALLAKLKPDEPGDDKAAVLVCDVRRLLREFAMMIPAADVVPKGAYDQVAWERDIAIQQLREDYGVGLGEKKSTDVAPVVPELRKTVELLHDEYEKAKQNPIVHDPLAYAVYQVWKAVDGRRKNGR